MNVSDSYLALRETLCAVHEVDGYRFCRNNVSCFEYEYVQAMKSKLQVMFVRLTQEEGPSLHL